MIRKKDRCCEEQASCQIKIVALIEDVKMVIHKAFCLLTHEPMNS